MTLAGRSVLVTGGTGFIGSALVRALVQAGAHVRSLDDDSRGAARRLGALAPAVERHTGDIRDPQAVARAVAGMDCVCHLAYVNGTENFYAKPELVLDVAIRGMLNVLDACRACGVRDLVLASSSEVYQTPPAIPTAEDVPLSVPDVLNPRFSYGGGKIACELLAVNYGRNGFDRVTIFRPHNVYGPDMGREHVIPQFALRMDQARRATAPPAAVPFPIQGSGRETRAFVYIDDLVDGVLRVIERGEHLGIYHIGVDHEVTVAELAREVGRCFGREVEVVPGALLAGSTPRRCPDISRIRALGYAPRVSLSEGLEKTVAWYVANP
jgi:dTDP-glucose 4,6-dehydratase/UDP-glucose 4-epimerase